VSAPPGAGSGASGSRRLRGVVCVCGWPLARAAGLLGAGGVPPCPMQLMRVGAGGGGGCWRAFVIPPRSDSPPSWGTQGRGPGAPGSASILLRATWSPSAVAHLAAAAPRGAPLQQLQSAPTWARWWRAACRATAWPTPCRPRNALGREARRRPWPAACCLRGTHAGAVGAVVAAKQRSARHSLAHTYRCFNQCRPVAGALHAAGALQLLPAPGLPPPTSA
jgi:hypothetical protein